MPTLYAAATLTVVTTVGVNAIRTATAEATADVDVEVTGYLHLLGAGDNIGVVDQTAPFTEQAARAYNQSARIDQTAPFASQFIATITGPGYGNIDQTAPFAEQAASAYQIIQAVIDQTAPFAEQAIEGHNQSARIDQTAPFAGQTAVVFIPATTADIDQTAPFARQLLRALNETAVCPTGWTRQRRCCCCGQMDPGRSFPWVETKVGFGADGSNQTLHNITLPTGIEYGDLVIVAFSNDGDATADITTPAAGYTKLFSTVSAAAVRLTVWYRWATGGELAVQVTTSASESGVWVAHRIVGADHTINPGAAIAATGTGVLLDSPNCNPWGGNSFRTLWITVTAWDDNVFPVDGPDEYFDVEGFVWSAWFSVAGNGIIMASRRKKAATENPGPWESSAPQEWVANTIGVMGAPLAPH